MFFPAKFKAVLFFCFNCCLGAGFNFKYLKQSYNYSFSKNGRITMH